MSQTLARQNRSSQIAQDRATMRDRTDALSAPVFTKTASIVQVGSVSTPGIVSVQLAAIDTSGLPSYNTALDWDLIVVDGAGKHYPALRGALGVEIEANTAQ